ncbi:MAG: hypothetical protein U0401_11680 [Anaerolineae bacterium]
MEPQVAEHFAEIIALAQATFEQVEHNLDATPARAILRLQASYGLYRVFISELFSADGRQYRYYEVIGLKPDLITAPTHALSDSNMVELAENMPEKMCRTSIELTRLSYF